MTDKTSSRPGDRRHARYAARSTQPLTATLTYRGEQGAVAYNGTVIDISQGGTKLELNDTPPIKSEVALEISRQSAGDGFDTVATVCWVRPAKRGGKYWIGLAFAEELADDVIVQLARAGHLDRRQDIRHEDSIGVTIRWELVGREYEATIVDYSVGGFCFECDEVVEPGDRLLLHSRGYDKFEEPIPARVCWVRPTQESHMIGCSFANKMGFREFRRRFLPETPAFVRRTAWLAVAAGFVASALGAYYLIRSV